jgi:hypothetical protein
MAALGADLVGAARAHVHVASHAVGLSGPFVVVLVIV